MSKAGLTMTDGDKRMPDQTEPIDTTKATRTRDSELTEEGVSGGNDLNLKEKDLERIAGGSPITPRGPEIRCFRRDD